MKKDLFGIKINNDLSDEDINVIEAQFHMVKKCIFLELGITSVEYTVISN